MQLPAVFEDDPSHRTSPSKGRGAVADSSVGAAERELHQQQALADLALAELALAELALALGSDRPFDDLIQLVTDRAREVIGADLALTSRMGGGPAGTVTRMSLSARMAGCRDLPVPPHEAGLPALVCERNRSMRLTQAELHHPVPRGAGGAGDIRKHVAGASFELMLSGRDGGHLLEIRDDGPGFDVDAVHAGGFDLGLASMRERAELGGGWFVVHSAPGEGTSLRVWIPDTA
ncbi:MAG TPA: ATP-binding protein [Actinomycetota bacterium]